MHERSYVGMTGDSNDDEEAEANQFGSHFLLPKEAFDQELEESSGLALVDLVLHIKRKFRVSYKTVLFRHDFVESGLSRLVKQAYKQELISASRAAEILQIPLDEMRGLESNWVTVDVGE